MTIKRNEADERDDRIPSDFKVAVEKLRQDMLCSSAEEALGLVSGQHYLLALAALETARCHLELCTIHYIRELGLGLAKVRSRG